MKNIFFLLIGKYLYFVNLYLPGLFLKSRFRFLRIRKYEGVNPILLIKFVLCMLAFSCLNALFFSASDDYHAISFLLGVVYVSWLFCALLPFRLFFLSFVAIPLFLYLYYFVLLLNIARFSFLYIWG